MKIAAPVEISEEQIASLITSAIDSRYGYSYYWIDSIEKIIPSAWTFKDELRPDDQGNEHEYWLHEYPLNPGGALLIKVEEEDKPRRLDLLTIERGLTLMAEHSLQHFADILTENEDAITGDVFLQYCLLGKIVYS